MTCFPSILSAWGTSGFEQLLKDALTGMRDELPLQAGLTSGSYALKDPLDMMVISTSETKERIEAKVGIFYESLTPGCACAGDPTVESASTEHITVLVSIDKQSTEVFFQLLED